MRNWLGQELLPGFAVYRGARDGNNSSFKVGIIQKVNEDKQKVTVKWYFEDGVHWSRNEPMQKRVSVPKTAGWSDHPSIGHCAPESLVAIGQELFDQVQRRYEVAKMAQEQKWTADQLTNALNSV